MSDMERGYVRGELKTSNCAKGRVREGGWVMHGISRRASAIRKGPEVPFGLYMCIAHRAREAGFGNRMHF